MTANKRAVVLLSGGLDSAVTLYIAKKKGYECSCLIMEYGQRHRKEIECAKKIAGLSKSRFENIKFTLPWKGSSLLTKDKPVPNFDPRGKDRTIPSTYVPARNLIFISFAVSYAEAIGARAIFIGAHSQDYSGYPDCRPEFFRCVSLTIKTGTRAGEEGRFITVKTPLLHKNKSQIIKMGIRLRVPLKYTWSCYRGEGKPCLSCDSCYYRQKGFFDLGIKDPAL